MAARLTAAVKHGGLEAGIIALSIRRHSAARANTKPASTLAQQHNQRVSHRCINEATIWHRQRTSSKQCLVSRFDQVFSFSRHQVQYQQQVKMLSSIGSRLMLSTSQKNHVNFGSGSPIKSEKESLLSHPKGNKRIKINACGQLYEELCKSNPNLYDGAPKGDGINFEIRYYDSLELLNLPDKSEAPIVCLLHGAPGDYSDFTSLINDLTKRGIRVLAPNLPDYSATYEHKFRHSPSERIEYLLKFFEAIKISRLDMIIGHSGAVYTVLGILDHCRGSADPSNVTSRWALAIDSIGLFNTPTYNLPSNLSPTPVRMFTLKLFDYHLFRPIIKALIKTIVRLQGIVNRVEPGKIEDLLLPASVVGYGNPDKSADHLKMVRKLKIPAYVLIGCKDKLIPMRCFEQLKRDLGITNDRQVKQYNGNGELINDPPNELSHELVDVSQFVTGGHYVFKRYAKQVNEDVYHFLTRKVLKPQKESTRL